MSKPRRSGWIQTFRHWFTCRCPDCHGHLTPVIYGYPTSDTSDAHARGEIVLGGCVLQPDSPKFACTECGWAGRRRPGRR